MKLIPSMTTLKPLLFSVAGGFVADFAVKQLDKYATEHGESGFGKLLSENEWASDAVVMFLGMILLNYQKDLGAGIFIVSGAQLVSSLIEKAQASAS